MGDFSEQIFVNDKPLWADAVDATPASPVKPRACGACGSVRTTCVYSFTAGAIIGWLRQQEFRCEECGKFTGYESTYES